MRQLPKGVDPNLLPDLAHYRGHGIGCIVAWCLTPGGCHRAPLTFEELAAHGASDTKCRTRAIEPNDTGQGDDSEGTTMLLLTGLLALLLGVLAHYAVL